MRLATRAAAVLLVGTMVALPVTVRGEPQCTCRYAGQSYALEACVCLVTPAGARMACCDQVLNNSSWTFTGDSCPVAHAPAVERPLSTAALRQVLEHRLRF